MKNILVGIVILFVSKLAIAQKKNDKSSIGYYLIFPIELTKFNSDNLDKILQLTNLPSSNFSKVNLGIGFKIIADRHNFSFSYSQLTTRNKKSNLKVSSEIRNTSFDYGYNILEKNNFIFYPRIGFKGIGLGYRYEEYNLDTVNFSTYLQKDLNYKDFYFTRANLDIGIGAAYSSLLLVDFKFGYLLPIDKVQWGTNKSKSILTNGPTLSYKYYFSIIIGMGNKVKM